MSHTPEIPTTYPVPMPGPSAGELSRLITTWVQSQPITALSPRDWAVLGTAAGILARAAHEAVIDPR